MSILSKVAGKAIDTTEDFLQEFCDSITREEWAILAQLPPMQRVTSLVAAVADLRRELAFELPAGHPLAALREEGDRGIA